MAKAYVAYFLAALFLIIGFLILYDQFLKIEIWFQIADIHHETLALFSFALAIGILIGSLVHPVNEK